VTKPSSRHYWMRSLGAVAIGLMLVGAVRGLPEAQAQDKRRSPISLIILSGAMISVI
jgi:hypothetical protein